MFFFCRYSGEKQNPHVIGNCNFLPNIPQKLHDFQAIENVGTVMVNLLKVQTRLETARDKLKELTCKESQERPFSTISCIVVAYHMYINICICVYCKICMKKICFP